MGGRAEPFPLAMFTRSELRMKKIFLLAVCLLSILACNKRPAPAPVTTAPAILPQFAQLNDLYRQFQGFRNDRLYLRHGFTANFPQSDWLQRVRDLGRDPELAERSRLLASLAIASRIHGDSSRVTRSFEQRFTASLHTPGPPLPEEEGTSDAGSEAGMDAQPPGLATTHADNATKEASAESSQADGITSRERTDLPQRQAEPASSPSAPAAKAESPPAPSARAAPDPTAGIPDPVHSQTHMAPAEPTQSPPAPLEPPPTAQAAGPDTQTAPTPSRQTAEELAPATPHDVEAQPLPAQPETLAPAGDTEAQTSAPPVPAQQPQPAAGPSETGAKITILFTGDTQGVVYPQPGINGTVGGIARRLPAIERVRAEAPALVLLDAGDAFVSGSHRAERINKILVRAMNHMRYDAMGLGPYDLDMGEMALRELAGIASFPFVCSNLEFQQDVLPWIKKYVLIERGRHTIAVISLLNPAPAVKITGARLIAPELAMNTLMPQLAAKADAVVLLTQTGREEILPMVSSAPVVDVILGDARSVFQDTPRYVPAIAKGMGLGLVELDQADGVFRPGRSVPLFTSGETDPNLLKMRDEIQN